jgi:hypothetical protein
MSRGRSVREDMLQVTLSVMLTESEGIAEVSVWVCRVDLYVCRPVALSLCSFVAV